MMIDEGGRYDSANPDDLKQKQGLPGSQQSDETLALAKQASAAGVGAEKAAEPPTNARVDDSQMMNFEPSAYLIEEPLGEAQEQG